MLFLIGLQFVSTVHIEFPQSEQNSPYIHHKNSPQFGRYFRVLSSGAQILYA